MHRDVILFALISSLFLPVSACNSGSVNGTTPLCEAGACDAGPGDRGLVFPDGPRADGPKTDGPPSCAPGTTLCGKACCTKDQICQEEKCQNLGYACDDLWPCPPGFTCDDLLGRCVPGASQCEYRPKPGVFKPKLEWAWTGSTVAPTYNQVMMAPMVANLTDDNSDGKIDRNDIPDIVFATFAGGNYQHDGILRVISGDGKKEHFSITDAKYRVAPGTQVAMADVDNDHKVEIFACASGGGTIAFENDGTFKWQNASAGCYAPSVADLDGDGNPEVIVRQHVLDGKTGALKWSGKDGCGVYSTAADINDDGKPEVVCGRVVYTWDGKTLWNDTKQGGHGNVAIADLDGDGKPEIVTTVGSEHAIYANHADGTRYFGPVDINQGHADPNNPRGPTGGGPPTIADFDGDGKPEIAAAAGWGYVIFENDGKPKWFQKTQDLSSRATGSSVFDFEGDGKAEVVYGDELVLRIYEGTTGKVLFSRCSTSGTLQEYPLIVDVDNDDHAEIVVGHNNYAFKTCADGSPATTGIT
ncbi:MAG: VCBS repeat-containing protein, partial [Deltaproteobacteria bacterium]|nr:VCBS repeat-containing protein [Deltaproteobacteria bacterium]